MANKNKKKDTIPSELLESINLKPAKQLEHLKELIFNSCDSNDAKIEFVRDEIKRNVYQVNAESIVNKMLENIEMPEVETEETEPA